jgi:hypothetical protein
MRPTMGRQAALGEMLRDHCGLCNGALQERCRVGVFLAILNAKAESAGREVTAVDPRNTSRRCPECGHTAKENRPTQEKSHGT